MIVMIVKIFSYSYITKITKGLNCEGVCRMKLSGALYTSIQLNTYSVTKTKLS